MKIIFITTKLNLNSGGGSHQSLHLVASELMAAGNQVTVITLLSHLNAFPPGLPYQVIAGGECSRSEFVNLDILKLIGLLRQHEKNVDIYYLWDPLLIFGGGIYRLLGGKIPLAAYLNGYSFCNNLNRMDTECYKNCGLVSKIMHRPEAPFRKLLFTPLRIVKNLAEFLVVNKIDAFIPISPAVADIYSRQHFDKAKMHVIPAGIDYSRIAKVENISGSVNYASRPFNIIYAGRLEWLKGVDLLIKAVSKLDFKARLNIVGDGPEKNNLKHLAGELGLADRVIFHGWVSFEAVVKHYQASQLFVHPARWPEPLGRTVLDAMALGLPSIVADCGGAAWAVKDAGLVFQPGDVDDLAGKIKSVYENPAMAEDTGIKARNRAKEFDCRRTIPQLVEVFKSLCKRV